MKKLSLLIFMLAVIGSAMAQLSGPPSGDNQKARVSQWIGPVEVDITYSSPDVHAANGDDRKGSIWGVLVHTGFGDQGFGVKAAPWRAGANENTVIKFSNDVNINGKPLKAGTYGLFMAFEKTGPSTWVFSNNSTSWGSFSYKESEDALRVEASGTDAPYTEYLTYGFDDRLGKSATAYVQWENKRFSFKIEVPDVDQLYLASMRNELRSVTGFDARNYSAAAQFCATRKINLEEALTWADHGINPDFGGVRDFNGLQTKAAVLTAMGKDADATAVMDEAIKSPTATTMAIHQYAKTLLAAGQKEKAVAVFQYNMKAHPEEKFITYVGLARGYTAMGDKKNAIKNWEIAIKNIPPQQKVFEKTYQAELDKLKS